MPTKEDVFRLGDTLTKNIVNIGKTIQENKLKLKTQKVLNRLDAKNPDSVNSTVLFLTQTGQTDVANSIKSWYSENVRLKDEAKKEGMFNALNKFNYTGLTRKDDYRVGAGDEDKTTFDPFNPETTYPTASEKESQQEKWSTIKESAPFLKDGEYWRHRYRSSNTGGYEIVETVNVNDPSKKYNYSQVSSSSNVNAVNKGYKYDPESKETLYLENGVVKKRFKGRLTNPDTDDALLFE